MTKTQESLRIASRAFRILALGGQFTSKELKTLGDMCAIALPGKYRFDKAELAEQAEFAKLSAAEHQPLASEVAQGEPKNCPTCGHEYHIGNGLGDICVGCPCDYREEIKPKPQRAEAPDSPTVLRLYEEGLKRERLANLALREQLERVQESEKAIIGCVATWKERAETAEAKLSAPSPGKPRPQLMSLEEIHAFLGKQPWANEFERLVSGLLKQDKAFVAKVLWEVFLLGHDSAAAPRPQEPTPRKVLERLKAWDERYPRGKYCIVEYGTQQKSEEELDVICDEAKAALKAGNGPQEPRCPKCSHPYFSSIPVSKKDAGFSDIIDDLGWHQGGCCSSNRCRYIGQLAQFFSPAQSPQPPKKVVPCKDLPIVTYTTGQIKTKHIPPLPEIKNDIRDALSRTEYKPPAQSQGAAPEGEEL